MTSTHSANTICCAAALANLQVIRKERLIDNVVKLAPILADGIRLGRQQKLAHGLRNLQRGEMRFLNRHLSRLFPVARRTTRIRTRRLDRCAAAAPLHERHRYCHTHGLRFAEILSG